MSNIFKGRSGSRAEEKHIKALQDLLTKPLPGIGKIAHQDTPCECAGCPQFNDRVGGKGCACPDTEDPVQGNVGGKVRTFDTGATRDRDDTKVDPEGFLSPAVLLAYCEYMHKHRVQSDGSLRDSDNWQKGIPLDAYMKSLLRHVFDLWMEHRGLPSREGLKDALCGIIFNVQGYLFEVLKKEG